jgi:hypothetical protein
MANLQELNNRKEQQMAIVVLDSGNKEAVLADALGEAPEPPKSNGKDKEAEGKAEAAASGDGVIPGETKPDNKEEHPDDVEGDDGLTANQKKELSAKMLKAIGKKHREMKEAEEFAAAQYSERKLAEQRADQLQAALDAAKGKPAEKAEEVAKPDRQNFGTETEYVEALTDWKVDQALAKHAAEQAKQAQERSFAEMEATAKQRIQDAIKLVPDFKEVTGSSDEIIPPAVAGYMQESEMFAELGYHLAKHPELVVSLSKLKPALQLVQIGKIESTLQPFSKEEPKDGATPSKAVPEAIKASETTGLTPSKARNTAPVIQPLSTVGAAVEKDPVDMNIRETISDWQKRNNANLAMRKRH